jgi:hypothetical protein
MHIKRLASLTLVLAFFSAGQNNLQAFTITSDFSDSSAGSWTDSQRAVVNQAITNWTSRLSFAGANDQDVPIEFYFTSAGTASGSYLAQWQFLIDSSVPFPYSPGITQFVAINSDYLPSDCFILDGPAPGKYDMLTVITHELGHALGFASDIYDNWRPHIIQNVFDPGGLNVPMMADGAHVNVAGDLMAPTLGQGVRRSISDTDLSMLAMAYGYSITPAPEPTSLLVLGLGAASLLLHRCRARR